MTNIAVGADGSGTTLQEFLEDEEIGGQIVLVFTSKPDCRALEYARKRDIDIVARPEGQTMDEFNKRLFGTLKGHRVDLICLAGYLKLIPEEIVKNWPKAILNSHPARDLKRFGGKGMYGLHVPEAVIAAGDKITGSTIHFADEVYDHGAIVDQTEVEVLPNDDAQTLMDRQLPLERKLYVGVVHRWLAGKL